MDKPRLLIVEDEPDLAEIVSDFIESDFEPIICTQPDRLLEILSTHQIDIVLTDVNLPGFSGESIVRLIRQYSKHAPIVLLTGQALDEPETQAAMQAGASGYIGKPFSSPQEIIPVLKSALLQEAS